MSAPPIWLDILRDASRRLIAAGVEGAPRDARLLLADALGVTSSGLILVEADPSSPDAFRRFEARLARRIAGEPVSRIRGAREFYGRFFRVTPDVLDPRSETELLIDEALRRLPLNGRILDLGTGSGCIMATLLAERPDASGVGVDVSAAALDVARANAADLDIASRASFIEGGWGAASGQIFDLVVSNPPYIRSADIPGLDREVRDHDPRLALDGGEDGLAPYRAICGLAPQLLTAGGWLALEIGAGQWPDVDALMRSAGLVERLCIPDLAGHDRVALGRSAIKAC